MTSRDYGVGSFGMRRDFYRRGKNLSGGSNFDVLVFEVEFNCFLQVLRWLLRLFYPGLRCQVLDTRKHIIFLPSERQLKTCTFLPWLRDLFCAIKKISLWKMYQLKVSSRGCFLPEVRFKYYKEDVSQQLKQQSEGTFWT